jgi:tetratricopeptide (TPR) repeat protein
VPRRSVAIALVVAGTVLSLGGSAAVQVVRDRSFPLPSIDNDVLDVRSGSVLRRLTVGYSALAADLYWIRAIQYYGGLRLRNASRRANADGPAADYGLLYPLLDLTTDLDPQFTIAYRFGSIFLAEPAPGGVGRPDQAIALLKKGLQASPGRWQYAHDIGFVYYWWEQDYRAASEWFDRASRMPDAPWWLRALAATTLLNQGDRASSRQMWQSIRDSADNDWLRQSAERALLQLQALDDIERLQPFVDRARARGNVFPAGAPVEVNGRLAADPTGVPLVIDAAGRVTLGPGSSLLPLPAALGSAGRAQ